jgi:hypothetical protein
MIMGLTARGPGYIVEYNSDPVPFPVLSGCRVLGYLVWSV